MPEQYDGEWKTAKNRGHYQVWRQTRALDQDEPMHSGVRETWGWFDTREEAQDMAERLNAAAEWQK